MIIELLAAGGAVAFGYARYLKKEADSIKTEIRGAIHNFKAEGLQIRLDVKLKNPTKTDFKFSFPFIELKTSRDESIGSSQASRSVVFLKAGEEKTLEPIFLTIPLSSILRMGLAFVKALKDGEKGLKLKAVATSYAHLLFDTVKHKTQWTSELTLLREKQET